jgi:hypothetical protein
MRDVIAMPLNTIITINDYSICIKPVFVFDKNDRASDRNGSSTKFF